MIVSNSPTLKVGKDFRTPGEPVPEFADFKPRVQRRMIERRRVIEVSPETAAEMRERHAKKTAEADRERKERKLRELQCKVKDVNDQIATSRDDTSNKERILDELEQKLLTLGDELGLGEEDLELAVRQPPPAEEPLVPLADRPDPQALVDELVDISALDITNLAAERFDIELDPKLPRETMVGLLFAHVYGSKPVRRVPTVEEVIAAGYSQEEAEKIVAREKAIAEGKAPPEPTITPPKPTEEIGRQLGLSQEELEASRTEARTELEEFTVTDLKELAKEHGASTSGNKAELIDAIVAAQEKEAAQGANEDSDEAEDADDE